MSERSRSTQAIAGLSDDELSDLAAQAWRAREHAVIRGATKVGCAVRAEDGRVFTGCNIEHRFRSHDIHAEVNALGALIAGGARNAMAIVIAAEREQFTPCGACMDWIMELGVDDCVVAFQPRPGGQLKLYRAKELMPHYPR